METNNFDNQENFKKLEGEKATDNALEMGSPESSLDSNLESEYNKISEIAENSEATLAKLKEAQAEIEKIEINIDDTKSQINNTRAELGLLPEEGEIPSLKNKNSLLSKLKDYVSKTAKALTVAGVMFGATDSFSQTNNTPDKNLEKTEIKTEIKSFYDRLQEYKIIPESMTTVEFQSKWQDEEWKKQVTEEYKEARGIAKDIPPNAKTIEIIQYGINLESQEQKNIEVNQEERKKEIEKIWIDFNKGKYKLGDQVRLSTTGEVYIIKKYKPGSIKESQNNQDTVKTNKSFKLLKDYK